MNTLLNDIINLVLDNGGNVELSKQDDKVVYDLRTDMKSRLVVWEDGDVVQWEGRYDRSGTIEDMNDLFHVAKDCMCGRDFLHHAWEKILVDNGYLRKVVTTTTSVSYE